MINKETRWIINTGFKRSGVCLKTKPIPELKIIINMAPVYSKKSVSQSEVLCFD